MDSRYKRSYADQLFIWLVIQPVVFFYGLLFGKREWFLSWSLNRYLKRREHLQKKVQLAFSSLLAKYEGHVEVGPAPRKVPPFGYITVYINFADRDFNVLVGRSELLISLRSKSAEGAMFSAGLPNSFSFKGDVEAILERSVLFIEARWDQLSSATPQQLQSLNMESR